MICFKMFKISKIKLKFDAIVYIDCWENPWQLRMFFLNQRNTFVLFCLLLLISVHVYSDRSPMGVKKIKVIYVCCYDRYCCSHSACMTQ